MNHDSFLSGLAFQVQACVRRLAGEKGQQRIPFGNNNKRNDNKREEDTTDDNKQGLPKGGWICQGGNFVPGDLLRPY